MKYALGEKDVILQRKGKEDAERKLKAANKEKEDLQKKITALTAEKTKAQQLADSRVRKMADETLSDQMRQKTSFDLSAARHHGSAQGGRPVEGGGPRAGGQGVRGGQQTQGGDRRAQRDQGAARRHHQVREN